MTKVSLPDTQCGFRAGRSTTQLLAAIWNIQQHGNDSNAPIVAVFLDFRRAFDSPPKRLILDRLAHLGAPLQFLSMIKRLNGSVKATVAGDPSATFSTDRGVKQVSAVKGLESRGND